VVFCLLPLSQQALVVGEVDQPNRPQLVTKNRAKHFNELREQAASMEEGVVARVRSVFFAKLVGFARIRREIARRRHQLALGLHRRIESRSALPWYKTWCRFATARTSKRKNSMRFLSIVKHDEFLPMRLIFQQWREIAIANSTVRREREATQKVLLDSEADDQLEASRQGSKMEEGSLKEEL
jgi:hypothetical protein